MSSKFPSAQIPDPAEYMVQYFARLNAASASIEPDALRAAATLLRKTVESGHWVYACGNGGSAAISNHLHCDFAKGIRTGTGLKPRIHSLAAHLELITAVGNDIGYEDIFVYQLSGVGQPDDVLIAVSSSGNSENIIRPLAWARENGLRSIALTGFDGGRAAALADINIHVAADNYGIVEDLHQSLMHILAQYIRQGEMTEEAIAGSKF